jgi:hypothetical protein
MDLGMTALGNWKAQQGGCTHIQVSPLRRCFDRGRHSPPPLFACSSSTRSTTSSAFPLSSLTLTWTCQKSLLTHPSPPPPPGYLLPLSPVRSRKVHKLRHGILQALPPTKPPHGGARRSRIEIISYFLVALLSANWCRASIVHLLFICPQQFTLSLIIACCSKNTTRCLHPLSNESDRAAASTNQHFQPPQNRNTAPQLMDEKINRISSEIRSLAGARTWRTSSFCIVYHHTTDCHFTSAQAPEKAVTVPGVRVALWPVKLLRRS